MLATFLRRALPLLVLGSLTLSSCVVHERGPRRGPGPGRDHGPGRGPGYGYNNYNYNRGRY